MSAVSPRLSAASPLEWLFAELSLDVAHDVAPLADAALAHLIEQARAGDREARHALYVHYVGRVFRAMRGMLPSDADAEDVTQDAMLKVLTSLGSYRPRADASFAAWVMTIATNTARRRFRRRRPELTATGDLPEVPEDPADPTEILEHAERRRALLMALAELPARDREIISLRYGADLNATEIGAAVGSAPATIRKTLERLRGRLGDRVEALLTARGHTR